MRALMIAFGFAVPYHTLRCAAAAGASVHILGNGAARRLRMSRYCSGFLDSKFDFRAQDLKVIEKEISRLALENAIDIVFPSDDVSTRLLIRLRDFLSVRTSPLPDLECFDTLNNKWKFSKFCLERNLRVPHSTLYKTPAELSSDLRSGQLELPITVKPVNRSASIGVFSILGTDDIDRVETIDYSPILVQRHIYGETIGISVLCRHGTVVAHATQLRTSHIYRLFEKADLFETVSKICDAAKYHGPANFDVVVEKESGLSYVVECNPRFWFTISMAMLLGLNFVELCLNLDSIEHRQACTLKGLEMRLSTKDMLMTPWKCTKADVKMLAYRARDPAMYLTESLRWFDDSEVAVPVGAEAE